MIYHCDISICYHIGNFSLRLASMFYLTRRITLRTFQFLAEIDHIRLNYIKMNWKIPHFRGFFSWFCGLCLLFTLTLSICLFCLPLHSWFFGEIWHRWICVWDFRWILSDFIKMFHRIFKGFRVDFWWILNRFLGEFRAISKSRFESELIFFFQIFQ